MDESKPFKEQEPSRQTASEPAMSYSSVAMMEDFANNMPQDVLKLAVEFAVKEHREDKCIPSCQIDSIIKGRMGWK